MKVCNTHGRLASSDIQHVYFKSSCYEFDGYSIENSELYRETILNRTARAHLFPIMAIQSRWHIGEVMEANMICQ